ncbi:MAG: hypothetical protein WCI21_06415, partial [Alphaproteobacteria bacterium]
MLRRLWQVLVALFLVAGLTSAWAAYPPAAAKAAPKAVAPKAAARAPAGPLANWAGFFVSGDYRAHSGMSSEVFDNGRRDVGAAFVAAGLKPENVVHFSPMDRLHASSPEKPEHLSPKSLLDQLTLVTGRATGGCVFFLTSHGAPQAIIMGDGYLDPAGLKQLLDETCRDRPTVRRRSTPTIDCSSSRSSPERRAVNLPTSHILRSVRFSAACVAALLAPAARHSCAPSDAPAA